MWKALGLAGMVLAAGEAWGCEVLGHSDVVVPANGAKGAPLNQVVLVDQEAPNEGLMRGMLLRPAQSMDPARKVATEATVLQQLGHPGHRLVMLRPNRLLEARTLYAIETSDGMGMGTFETGDAEEAGVPEEPVEVARTVTPTVQPPPMMLCALPSPCAWQSVVDVQPDAALVVAVRDGETEFKGDVLGWSSGERIRFQLAGDGCLQGSESFRLLAVGNNGRVTLGRGAAQVGSVTRAGCSQAEWGEAGGVLWMVVGTAMRRGTRWGRRNRGDGRAAKAAAGSAQSPSARAS